MKLLRIALCLSLLILMFFSAGCSASQEKREKKFNILLISIDTLRADHLHCYGYEYETSPRIDALSRQSLFFEFAFCPIPKTSASFASMMTGLHPYIHKTKPNLGELKEKYITLAEVLQLKGYETAAVVDNVNLSKKFFFNQGFYTYTEVWNETEKKSESTPFITEKVLSFLNKKREKPFFLWANYIETHTPYIPPQKYVDTRPPGRDIRTIKRPIIRNYMKKIIEAESVYNEGHYIALYDGAVHYVDAEMGKIIDTYHRLGLNKNTIFIFTADHGEDLGERNFFYDHGPLTFTAASRVPLLVYIPGEKSRRIKTPVSIMDIYPTILELLNLHLPYPLQGVDLMQAPPDRLFYLIGWVGTSGVVKNSFQYVSVDPRTSRRLKLEPDHFYNIFDDPFEKNNLYSEYKSEARILHDEYLKYQQKHGYFERDEAESKKKSLTKKELKKLRSLGYLND